MIMLMKRNEINDEYFTGMFITIGFLLREPVEDSYIHKENHAKARKLLIPIWMFLAFILSVGYTSVLLTTLVSIEYEKPVDTAQDLVNADKPIYVYPTTAAMLSVDPRENVRDLAKKLIATGYESQDDSYKDIKERWMI